jgi:Winged helix-turn helix
MAVVSMSKKEFDRLEVLLGVRSGRLRVADACELLGLKRRHIFRLLAGLKHGGAASLVSKRRGRPSNNRLPEAYRDLALSLVRERYADFGPTLAAEKLAEVHGCMISRETLRVWMIAAGLWVDRRHRLPSPHQPRRRRDCLGELVQIDGSEHAWFEDRAAKCTLLAFVDDATSRLMHLRFVASESAFDYFRATRTYIETHGKPVAFYSDKHGIFRVNAKDAAGGNGTTQFGRALTELNIDILCANSPQAKGRVERAFGTLQDRLVKELRLAGLSTVEAANAWLPGFIEDYNRRFGRAPANAKDLHRPLTEAENIDEILAWREERSVTRNLTLRYDRMMLLLDPTPLARGLAGKTVEVVNYPDGRFAVRHNGVAFIPRVRQDRDGGTRRDCREQAARGGAGVGEGAAGVVSAEPSPRQPTTPATAQQSGGTRYADKGPPLAKATDSSGGRVIQWPDVISTLHVQCHFKLARTSGRHPIRMSLLWMRSNRHRRDSVAIGGPLR